MSDTPAKRFQDEIGRVLSLTAMQVASETLVGHKKVDLLVLEQRFSSVHRIAVECKKWARPLTKSQLLEIYIDYHTLYEANLIDELLIVTENGLTAGANTLVRESRGLSHVTLEKLYSTILDFGPYLAGLIAQFEQSGLPAYYIRPTVGDGIDLEDDMFNWIESKNSTPIAILGGYGSGKTTFAKRLCHALARMLRAKGEGRLPIYVPLSEISSEQSLEGLLGKLFTARTPLRNFSFDLFMRLNATGRFVAVLDGFDEMKHTLTWEAFRYNFRQLNRLVEGEAKVVILGRPTAFLSDEEFLNALRGERVVSGRNLQEPGWPSYKEYHLEAFSREQVRLFLGRYLSAQQGEIGSSGDSRKRREIVQQEIDYLVNESDLSTRPVQLTMLAEVLPTFEGPIQSLTEASLYSYFIDLIIEREQAKLSRKRFSLEERRKFAREVALFLWEETSEMNITAEALPKELLMPFVHAGEDLDGVRRDLVSACFLERKLGDSLYFPHRSFQEYLVAEAVVNLFPGPKFGIVRLNKVVTREIASFVVGLVSFEDLSRWIQQVDLHRGNLSIIVIEILLSNPDLLRFCSRSIIGSRSPWYPLLTTLGVVSGRAVDIDRDYVFENIAARMKMEVGQYTFVAFLCLVALSRGRGDYSKALSLLVSPKEYSPAGGDWHAALDPATRRILMKIDLDEASGKIGLSGLYRAIHGEVLDYCTVKYGEETGALARVLGDLTAEFEGVDAREITRLKSLLAMR